ncbi:hypothetical protein GCM10009596_15720 [Arthrobacter rhombi]|uniref:hypothetical protein n=1 Tax=Arthrobacter rhombi TaxID=71253 RepID=UPI0031D25859
MNSRTCSDTGLRLVDGPGRMYRVAGNAPDRGPLNPVPRRQGQVAERLGWNRYDTVGLTIYGAAHRDTALTESVAYRAPDANGYAALRTEAAYLGIGLDELLRDLRQAGVPVDGLGSEWSGSHFMYELDASQGEWVDIRHPLTIAALKGAGLLQRPHLWWADLMGEDRMLTTFAAEWLRQSELDTGSRPAGIRYASKFGMATDDDHCWAMFLDPSDLPRQLDQWPILAHAEDVSTAVLRTGVHIA